MNALERMGNCGIVPVVVIEDVKYAVATADALLAGGIDVMEVTLRTSAGLDAIRAVSAERPQILVGAGTVLTLEQSKTCVEAGAKFIVSPGFNAEMVKWCVDNGVAVTPGCVTPTEIMEATSLGCKVLKFFPANVYGGLSALKALAGPFGDVKFIPTGGVNSGNIGEFAASPFVHAVGGSWICPKADISEGNFEKVTALCKEAVKNALGFEVAHIGVNTANGETSMAVTEALGKAFGFEAKTGTSSNFAGSGIEVMKSMYLGDNGHMAIRTNDIRRAAAYLEKKGFAVDEDTAKYKADRLIAIYLKVQFGGFAVHLLQK
ncbi:MAG: bifunctional 4-hydroxy-2-oxoglutarate aldolase/2-dehydro-3-deoxy-phosphogluconate aldolase [Eubacteriales bacterium]|nr:bifunctional 4-hydroxy-2-oxoglutarate aldolase/2-dehydro-3-deoxy-phosphogluconate aldolase [Eubacteriales bacterium]